MFKLPKNSYILADKPSNAEDDDDSNEIEEKLLTSKNKKGKMKA